MDQVQDVAVLKEAVEIRDFSLLFIDGFLSLILIEWEHLSSAHNAKT